MAKKRREKEKYNFQEKPRRLFYDILPPGKIKKAVKDISGFKTYKTKKAKIFGISWRATTVLGLIFVLILINPANFLERLFYAFAEEEITVNFYSTLCQGDSESGATWQNPQNAQGPSDVLPSGDITSFNDANSAVYQGGAKNILCQNFITDVATTTETPTYAESVPAESIPAESATTTTTEVSTAATSTEASTVATTTESLITEAATGSSSVITATTTETIAPEEATTTQATSFFQEIKNYFKNLWVFAQEKKDFSSAKINFSFATRKKEAAATIEATTTTEAIVPEVGPPEAGGIAPAETAGTSTEPISTTTPTSPLATLNETLATSTTPTAKIIIWYSLDGELWVQLANISEDSLSNASNGGYFQYAADFLENWDDVKNLKIKFEGKAVEDENFIAYLDSVWLEVKYQQKLEEEFEIKTIKKDWRGDEEPEFEIVSLNKGEVKPKFLAKVISAFGGGAKIKLSLDSRENIGLEIKEGRDFKVETKSPTKIKLLKSESLRPGVHKLKIEFEKNGKTYNFEEDFSWGVLAINTNKSIYVSTAAPETSETAYLQMAALDDDGHTLCNANLKLQIVEPGGALVTFSTETGSIQKSGECGPNNVTDKPDYFAYYNIPNATGTYQMVLARIDKDTGAKLREIEDSFEVLESVPFDIERIGPTRIYPPAPYQMTLKIKANQFFQGNVVETVPANFDIEAPEATRIEMQDNSKLIIWELNLEAGESKELSYQFDAPDISPFLFLLGPAQIGDFQETRYWQVASDAVTRKIEQQINIITKTITSGGVDTGLIRIPTNLYNSATYYFEVVAKVSSGAGSVDLTYNAGTGQVASGGTTLTISNITATSYTLYRSSAFTPTGDQLAYISSLTGTGITVIAARIIILQSDATSITNTQTIIEMGDNMATRSAAYATLTAPKIYYYDSAKFNPAPTVTFQATLKSSTTSVNYGPNNPSSGRNATSTFTNCGSAGTVNWTGPSNVQSLDGAYATSSPTDNQETTFIYATGTSFAIPTNATILGISVEVVRRTATNNVIEDCSVMLLKAGAGTGSNYAATGTRWGIASTSVTYGGVADLWGDSWTPADINNTNFGVRFSIHKPASAGTTINTSVDVIRVTVFSSSAATTTVELYNLTDSIAVVNASTTVATTTDYSLATSSSFTLTSGKEYLVRIQTSTDTATATIANAKLVLTQANAGGIDQLETVQQYVNSLISDSDSAYTLQNFQNQYATSSFAGGTFNYFFEATMRTTAGTGYSQLYNVTGSDAIDTATTSEISTTAVSFARARSNDLSDNIDWPTATSTMDTQAKNSTTNTTEVSSSWLAIAVSNLTAAASVGCTTPLSTVTFSLLDNTSVFKPDFDATTTITTNNDTGFTMKVYDSGSGATAGLYKAPDDLIESPWATTTDATATLVAGTEGFGIQATSSTANIVVNPIYSWASSTTDVGALEYGSGSALTLATSSAPINKKQVSVTFRAAAAVNTPSGAYSDTITYTCTANP